jgi:hypothetical protein
MASKPTHNIELVRALAAIKKNGTDLVSIIQATQALYKQATEGYYVEKVTTQGIMPVKEVNLAVAASILKLQSEHLKWLYDRIEGYSEDEDGNKFTVTLNKAVPLVRSIK